MKTQSAIWIFFLAFACIASNGFSQGSGIPAGISYQAVARDAQGTELANSNITVWFSILKGSSDGDAQWVETHLATTDQYGLFNLVIGEGTRETESIVDKFSDISWGSDRYFLKVEIDFGSGKRNLGIMPFLSVPYALYAATSGSTGGSDNQSLHFDTLSHLLSIDRANSVDLSSLFSGDFYKSLISSISLSGDTLSISQSDHVQSINLSSLNQQISFDTITNSLYLSNGGSVSLSSFVKNSELSQFYISDMQLSGDSLVLIQGGTRKVIDLSYFHNSTSSLQRLSISNNILKLSQDTSSIDLSKYLDNTYQQISYDSVKNQVSLTNGGIINLPSFVKNYEAAKFYISQLELSGDSLIVYQGGYRKTINLSHFNNQQVFQHLSLTNNLLKLTNDTGSVDLSKYLDNKNQHLSLTNDDSLKLSEDSPGISLSKYRQSLSLSSNALYLSNDPLHPFVDLSTFRDNYYLKKDTSLNLYSLKDKNGNTQGDAIIPQDLNFDSDNNKLWITGNSAAHIFSLKKYLQQLHISSPNHLSIDYGDTVTIDTDPTNELQSLVLTDTILSLTQDPLNKKINLHGFDKQQLHVSHNKLSLDNGGAPVYIDTDTTNELQNISLNQSTNILSISKSSSTADLSKYQQSLSIANNQLSISNGNSVNLKQPIYAFRAVNTTTKVFNPNDTLNLDFTELLDSGSLFNYDALTKAGTFTCPPNGEGLYQFNVSVDVGSLVLLRIVKNDKIQETLQKLPSYSLLYYLIPGDRLYIRLVNLTSTVVLQSAYFMGYRINQ